MRSARAPAAALLLAACAGTPADVLPPPAGPPPFPHRVARDGLVAEAFAVPDPRREVGDDLRARGVLPVAVRLGALDGAAPPPRVPSGFAARLLLQDGTALVAVEPERVPARSKEVRDRVVRRALEPGEVPPLAAAEPRLLYFRLPQGVRVEGTRALVRAGGAYRSLDLVASLLEIEVERGRAGAEPVRVGLAVR